MIAFSSRKRTRGGIGNLMFQYAFTRMTARRLGVKFYFPEWIGDRVFCLNDEDERTTAIDVDREYIQSDMNSGFSKDALEITDGTDIYGFFQSEGYYPDKSLVRKWFTFGEAAIATVRDNYRRLDFAETTSLNFRFGEKKRLQDFFVMPDLDYYVAALSYVKHKRHLLVVSDEIERARSIARRLTGNVIYAEDTWGHEDLYLISQCHDNVSSPSTFSWWGAWLNPQPDKVVVCPREWLRPGYKEHRDLTCDGWIELQTVHPVFGHYRTVFLVWKAYRALERLSQRVTNPLVTGTFHLVQSILDVSDASQGKNRGNRFDDNPRG